MTLGLGRRDAKARVVLILIYSIIRSRYRRHELGRSIPSVLASILMEADLLRAWMVLIDAQSRGNLIATLLHLLVVNINSRLILVGMMMTLIPWR